MTYPTIAVEIAFGTGPGVSNFLTLDDTTRGLLNTGQLADDLLGGGLWVDVSTDARHISTSRGRRRQVEAFETGTLGVELDNTARAYDPTNLSGPYVSAGATLIRPMRPVRIRATYSGTTYDLIYGYADEWNIAWSDPQQSTTTLLASDGFKVLANFDPLEVAPVGASELTGARITRILDNASWPALDREIDAGNTTVQATNLSSNALTELKLTADTEAGELYMGANGKVIFRNRLARYSDTRSKVSQATYGDGPSDLNYASLGIAYNDDLVKNRVIITRVGGTAQTVNDTTSQALYLIRTYNRTDLIHETDAESLNYATYLTYLFANPDLRFDYMTLEPDGYDALWPEVLGRKIGDRITINRHPPDSAASGGTGTIVTRDCFIEGISHSIDPAGTGKWVTTFQLSDASKITAFTLDDTTFGRLDAGNVLVY